MLGPEETNQSPEPRIDPPACSLDRRVRLLEPIIYGDIFDYPLTLEEIWRFSPLPCSREEVLHRLTDHQSTNPLPRFIRCTAGFYHLEGREELAAIRQQRYEHSRRLWKRARRIASLIQYVPFLRSVSVTGSLASDNADRDADPDFLVITAGKRIWTVFFFLGTLQKLTSTKLLCPNFYISQDCLAIEPRDFFSAHEVAKAVPLYGIETFSQFCWANEWVRQFYPNCVCEHLSVNQPVNTRAVPKRAKQLLEWLAGGRLGERIEALFRRLLLHRLEHHYRLGGGEIPPGVLDNARRGRELRFHGLRHRRQIRAALEERLELLRKVSLP